MIYMRKAKDVFNEWAEIGKDLGMEAGHADAVEEMLEFSLKERAEIGEQFSFLDLGCGNGWATRNVYRESLCNRAVGVDGANKMVTNALNSTFVSTSGFFIRKFENEIKKLMGGLAEKAKVAIRNIRREANDTLKNDLKDKKISEDDSKNSEKKIQNLTDIQIQEVEKRLNEKEKEIMTV